MSIEPILVLFALILGLACGYIAGCDDERKLQQKELRALWSVVTEARKCAGKLRAELFRRTIEPRAEYEWLIEAVEKFNHRNEK